MALTPEQRTILGMDQESDIGIDEAWMEELVASFEERKPSALELAAQAERTADPVDPDPVEARNAAISATLNEEPNADAQGDAPAESATEPLAPPTGAPVADISSPDPSPSDPTPVPGVDNAPPSPVADPRTTQALDILKWAEALPAEVVEAFDAVESGRGVVISREDAEAFMAWKQGAPGPKPAATTFSKTALLPLDEYADESTKALYAQVEALTATVDEQRQAQISSEAARQRAATDAQIAQRAEVFTTSFTSAGEQSGLTPEDLVTVMQYASQTNLIRTADQELSRFDRNGRLLSSGDPAAVAQLVVERSIYAIPELRQRSIDAEVQRRLNDDQAAIIATNQKKNRAASLTSAPIAATTDNRDVRSMTPDERHAAITAAIRQATTG